VVEEIRARWYYDVVSMPGVILVSVIKTSYKASIHVDFFKSEAPYIYS